MYMMEWSANRWVRQYEELDGELGMSTPKNVALIGDSSCRGADWRGTTND